MRHLCNRLPQTFRLFPYTTLFRSTDLAESHSMIAELLRGERLVPPPPPPPEVFTNAEMRRFHPEVISADRRWDKVDGADRKSTRLNSSHVKISYAVFCLKKKIRCF